jgi:hypothetical protein
MFHSVCLGRLPVQFSRNSTMPAITRIPGSTHETLLQNAICALGTSGISGGYLSRSLWAAIRQKNPDSMLSGSLKTVKNG